MSEVELDENEFELEGIKYQAVDTNLSMEIPVCEGCAFDGENIRPCMNSPQCGSAYRKDGREVIFVKVEE